MCHRNTTCVDIYMTYIYRYIYRFLKRSTQSRSLSLSRSLAFSHSPPFSRSFARARSLYGYGPARSQANQTLYHVQNDDGDPWLIYVYNIVFLTPDSGMTHDSSDSWSQVDSFDSWLMTHGLIWLMTHASWLIWLMKPSRLAALPSLTIFNETHKKE